MNPVLTYFLSSIERSTSNLKLKNSIIDKPWVWVEDNTTKAKFIFKRNGTLVVSIAGIAHNGNWEYLSGAKSIHIDSGVFNFLLNEVYLDENILLFKLDASDDQLLAFCNETTISDLNSQRYLHEIYCTRHQIKSIFLYDGNLILVYGYNPEYGMIGKECEVVDMDFQNLRVKTGRFLSQNRKQTIYIDNEIISKICFNKIITLNDGSEIELCETHPMLMTRFGNNLPDGEYLSESNCVYIIENGFVAYCGWDKSHSLRDKSEIVIREQYQGFITKGDRIIGRILPDGKYKIKGKFRKINVKNQMIIKC